MKASSKASRMRAPPNTLPCTLRDCGFMMSVLVSSVLAIWTTASLPAAVLWSAGCRQASETRRRSSTSSGVATATSSPPAGGSPTKASKLNSRLCTSSFSACLGGTRFRSVLRRRLRSAAASEPALNSLSSSAFTGCKEGRATLLPVAAFLATNTNDASRLLSHSSCSCLRDCCSRSSPAAAPLLRLLLLLLLLLLCLVRALLMLLLLLPLLLVVRVEHPCLDLHMHGRAVREDDLGPEFHKRPDFHRVEKVCVVQRHKNRRHAA
mmetsp:Transcript_72791/g.213324  ORF Transcript_72791/g.213324 Transcript_72791/m.213324 type:complete len:265 (-) Transcript_72791:600-1394(-)